MAASSAYIWLSVIITLVSGTFSAVANKALYQMHTDGLCGSNTFGKAYMTTLWMFIGEALCLVYFYCNKWYQQHKHGNKKRAPSTAVGGNNQPLLAPTEDDAEAEDGVAEAKKPPVWVFVILSLFDLSATATNGVGLVYITASTNQMLRGSAVLFTGIFSILILKRRLSLKKWLGIGIVIAGLGIVGGSAALQAKLDEKDGKASDDANTATPLQAVLGVILVLVGSALNSAQNVFEEKLLKATGSAEIDPLEVVGWEGVSGMVLSAFILLPVTEAIPGSDCGTAESTTDSLIQMHNQPLIVGLLVLYAVCLAFMNYFSQVISKHLSAVHRMLVSTLRTVLVWVAGILLYYVFTHRSFGESWAVSSYMQLGGFACLIIGTFVYGMTAPEPADKIESVTEPVMDLPSEHEDSMFSNSVGRDDNRL